MTAGNSPAGEIRDRWREAGRWWDNEPYREVVRTILPSGKVDVQIRESPSVGAPLLDAGKEDFPESPPGEYDMRFVKQRDQKVLAALGELSPPSLTPLRRGAAPGYALLHALSGYAFGRSSMLAAEIPAVCAKKGIPAALISDPFSLAGAGEFAKTAQEVGIKPLIGASFELAEGGEIVLAARDRTGWRSLSRLITECNLDEPRLYPLAAWERLARHAEGLLCLTGGHTGPLARMLPRGDYGRAERLLERLIGLYGRDLTFVQVERSHFPLEGGSEAVLLDLAARYRLRAVAGGPATHASRSHFPAQDILACIHTLCGIEDIYGHKPPRHPDQPQVPPLPSPRAQRRAVRALGFHDGEALRRQARPPRKHPPRRPPVRGGRAARKG